MCVNNKVHYDQMVLFDSLHITLPHYHHYADLSESIAFLKCVSGTFCLECVPKIKSIISIISHALYGAVRIQLTHLSYDDCENTCTLSYSHHQIGSMTHLPVFRVRSWNNGMRCMSSYISLNAFSWKMYDGLIPITLYLLLGVHIAINSTVAVYGLMPLDLDIWLIKLLWFKIMDQIIRRGFILYVYKLNE